MTDHSGGSRSEPRRSLAALRHRACRRGRRGRLGSRLHEPERQPGQHVHRGLADDRTTRRTARRSSTPSNMKPGGAPQTGTVDIANSGDLGGAFTLTRDRLENTDTGESNPARVRDEGQPRRDRLRRVRRRHGAGVRRRGRPEVYDGTLAAMDGGCALGDFEPARNTATVRGVARRVGRQRVPGRRSQRALRLGRGAEVAVLRTLALGAALALGALDARAARCWATSATSSPATRWAGRSTAVRSPTRAPCRSPICASAT